MGVPQEARKGKLVLTGTHCKLKIAFNGVPKKAIKARSNWDTLEVDNGIPRL